MATTASPGDVQLTEVKATPAAAASQGSTFAPTNDTATAPPAAVAVAVADKPAAATSTDGTTTTTKDGKLPIFGYIATFITTAAAALFIIAITTNEMITTDQVVGVTGLTESGVTHSITLYGVTRGLWRVCYEAAVAVPSLSSTVPFGGPLCASISSDVDCDISFEVAANGTTTDDVPYTFSIGQGECSKVNTIRAFLIFAIITSVAASFAMKSSVATVNATKDKLSYVLNIIAALSGMIAMAIARDHYGDIAIHDYGVSFFALVLGWILSIVAVILWGLRPADADQGAATLGALSSLVAFVFFIVSASSNEIVYWTQSLADQSTSPATVTIIRQTLGFWKVCNGVVTSSDYLYNSSLPIDTDAGCEDVDNSCDVDDGSVLGQCRSLQTMRALLIMAVIFSFIAFFAKLAARPVSVKKVPYNIGIVGSVAAVICGFITMALSVAYYAEPATHWGFSFWCNVLGWVISLFGVSLMVWVKERTAKTYSAHVTRVITWIAFIFQITAITMPHWVYLSKLPAFADQFTSYHPTLKPVQYGLWKICFDGGSCETISSDDECTVGGDLPALSDCSNYNGIRGAVMLSALCTFLYLFCQWIIDHHMCAAERSQKIGRKVGFVWALLSVAWGVIATALGVNYFDVLATEYAFSFWLFLVSWILVIITVFIYLAPLWNSNRWSELLQYWATAAALVLFVLSASIHEFTRRDWDASYSTLASGATISVPATYQYSGAPLEVKYLFNATTGSYDIPTLIWQDTANLTESAVLANLTYTRASQYHGLFYTCIHNADGKTCTVLDSDCSTRYDTLVLPDCDQFNTLRAFVVMAILVSGLSLLFRTINFCARSRNLNTLAGVLSFLTFIIALIAVAVGLNWSLYSINEPSSHLGASAILLIVAWLITLRLTLAWNREANESGKKPNKDGFYLC